MRKIVLEYEPSLIAKLNAFSYQKEAFEAVKDLEYSAIFHEQGLGKTKIAIDLLLYWLKFKDVDTVLIVTKKQLVQNWKNEFITHTFIKPAILTSNRNDNFYVFNGPSRVVIANFEIISSEKERFHLYLKARNVAIIIDESAKIKNPNSKITRDFFELSSKFIIKTIMTGTPVANRPYDIWAQIYFLDEGKSLGKDFNEFKKKTDLSNSLENNTHKKELFEDVVSSIFLKIKSFSVRETKKSGVIDLPKKQYVTVWAEFEEEQKQIYDRIREEMSLLVKKGDKTILDDSSSTLKRLLRLVQVTSNPKLIDEMYFGNSAKESVLNILIDDIISKGEKCIVWSSFIENIDYFTKKYSRYNAVKIHGGMKIIDRNRSVEKFTKEECKILFATPQSSKEGLTLTMANHVIFYDRGFSLDDYLQAQDRIHRISQKKTCYIYNILIKDSIDIWIDFLLKAKQNAAFLAQGDVTKDEYRDVADYRFSSIIKKILNIDNTEEYL
ncbi:DEAD/DEAH box helicase [Clostridium paridis]|uniref:DEAD/DEAH box helicase n=1 Tax=Clostridium paridis TaxID=2803863 RepID=A0A937FJV9_9CLOT|nr:DEAD/DEAH box helicase [Clostridium paridis]MBL4933211.1 DEAD/DEAH box helicase [Clostridium paridis]